MQQMTTPHGVLQRIPGQGFNPWKAPLAPIPFGALRLVLPWLLPSDLKKVRLCSCCCRNLWFADSPHDSRVEPKVAQNRDMHTGTEKPGSFLHDCESKNPLLPRFHLWHNESPVFYLKPSLQRTLSRGTFYVHSFQRSESFFSGNHLKTPAWKQIWFLKSTMVEKNGQGPKESTPRLFPHTRCHSKAATSMRTMQTSAAAAARNGQVRRGSRDSEWQRWQSGSTPMGSHFGWDW